MYPVLSHPVLSRAVHEHVAQGGQVTFQDYYGATVTHGKRPNHILHLLLSIFTLGLWFPVWAVLDVTSRPKVTSLYVDARGYLHKSTRKQAVSLSQKRQAKKGSEKYFLGSI